jgi:hypothetical protein
VFSAVDFLLRQLDATENEARLTMLRDIGDAVLSKFPVARVDLFGSFPVGLSTFLSDVDVSITNVLSAEQREQDNGIDTMEEDDKESVRGRGEDGDTKVDVGEDTDAGSSGEQISWFVDAAPSAVNTGLLAAEELAGNLPHGSSEVSSSGVALMSAPRCVPVVLVGEKEKEKENSDDRIMKVIYLEEILNALQVSRVCAA